MSRKIYFISGTLGAGKTTVSKLLAERLENSYRIEADDFLHKTENSNVSWDSRLALMWDDVIELAQSHAGKNLVIDCVIEGELPKLKGLFKTDELYYAVLIASEQVLKARIGRRGDINSLDRSRELLAQLRTDPTKEDYLIDTSSLSPTEVADLLISLGPI